MHEKRLLERIRDYEKDRGRGGEVDPSVLLASVLSHLRRMLNTKQGSVPIAEDYGLADLTEMPGAFSPDNMEEIEQKMAKVIAKYDPRLADVRVRFSRRQDDSLALRFEISGRVNDDGLRLPVIFESVVEPSGKISVTS
ncbi:MAG: type VI secretion system baseplate subunit TssE [Solidesulfovibrio sp. DCME]|uniref:type VI secretion system baseplate subunit TssE n=1 Tax=Solidesulfovibrio sp. DCME TaxID=3447380 RepID=UPI003D14764A